MPRKQERFAQEETEKTEARSRGLEQKETKERKIAGQPSPQASLSLVPFCSHFLSWSASKQIPCVLLAY